MNFLIDADLPRSTSKLLAAHGQVGIDVGDIGLGDAEDGAIAAHASSHQVCLVTSDFGFADIRNYPPENYCGLVVLELPKDATASAILRIFEGLLRRPEILEKLPGRLAIVSASRVRLRPK